MASLEELVNNEGVVFACEFTADGRCIDYMAKTDMPREMADKAAEYIATVTMMFNTLAGSFTQISQMNWVPQQGWIYSGGDWTVIIGGNKAIFAETSKADLTKLHNLMMEQRVESQVQQSM